MFCLLILRRCRGDGVKRSRPLGSGRRDQSVARVCPSHFRFVDAHGQIGSNGRRKKPRRETTEPNRTGTLAHCCGPRNLTARKPRRETDSFGHEAMRIARQN